MTHFYCDTNIRLWENGWNVNYITGKRTPHRNSKPPRRYRHLPLSPPRILSPPPLLYIKLHTLNDVTTCLNTLNSTVCACIFPKYWCKNKTKMRARYFYEMNQTIKIVLCKYEILFDKTTDLCALGVPGELVYLSQA